MKRCYALLISSILAWALSGCTGGAPAPSSTSGGVEVPALLSLLSTLKGSDIGQVSWGIEGVEHPTADQVAEVIRAAAAHTTPGTPMTLNGTETDVVWSLELYLGPAVDGGWPGDQALHLYAGLRENLVEIWGGDQVAEGRLWVEDEALYQLVRTAMDTPDGTIDPAVYETYRDEVDGYLAGISAFWEGVSTRQVLIGLQQVDQEAVPGVVVYAISSVCITDPPEQAIHLLAGGAYVDSRLRIHGVGEDNLLVVAEGTPVGFVSWEQFYDGGLAQFVAQNAGETAGAATIDREFALTPEGLGGWYGLGGPGMGFLEEPGTVTRLDTGGDAIYAEGDYWERTEWEGLSILCYVAASSGGGPSISSLSTTRADLSTVRGAHVGMTRDQILACYPTASSEPNWDLEGDFLWVGPEDGGYGRYLIFYFEEDQATRIEMTDYFN